MEDILVPIFVVGGLWLMIAAISISGIVANQRAKRELHETMRRAIESGHQLSPETIASLMKPVRPWEQDLRSGIILTALAIGLGVAAAVNSAGDFGGSPQGFIIAAIIVGAIGAGQLVSAWLRRDRKA
ncbi:MAG: hypothetical protein KJS97_16565 [Alphaproteobacteria bacterium]|nr:hypothetical protein [Alphaproteobacteria bacterium]